MSAEQDSLDTSTDHQTRRVGKAITRRGFIARAAGGLAALGLAGLAGYEWPRPTSPTTSPDNDERFIEVQVQSFLTRPDLRPPAVRVTTHPGRSRELHLGRPPRFILAAPRNSTGVPSQPGLMLIDRAGRLIWFKPVTIESPFDFDAQDYLGTPRLTWWQGDVINAHGNGVGEMADSAYRTLGEIRAGNGLRADLHELNLTAAGTALITAYEQTTADLTALGGPRRAPLYVGHAQEIDLATGRVLFDWNSLDHVPLAESYNRPPANGSYPFDYFHINSVSETTDGNLLISARNTWALYKVDRTSGKVLWQINGKHSDFAIGAGANFYWQHDARMHGPSVLTVFDDGSDGTDPPQEAQSRALVLAVDETAMQVQLTHAYLHPGLVAADQGSVQLLDDGRVFVGWGNQPYFSEFAPDGTLVLDGEFPIGVRSYRAYTRDWVGHPSEPPAIAVRANPAGGSLVYASWNGATEISSWTVLAGEKPTALTTVGAQDWGAFETAIAVDTTGPYFAVAALDSAGRELGRSKVVR